nr:hypothetical protein Iba_chr09bCG14670 [Ipomoea batatas]
MLLLVLVEDSKDEAAIQGEGLASLRICLPEIKQKGTSPLLKAVSIFFAKLMSSGSQEGKRGGAKVEDKKGIGRVCLMEFDNY